MPTVSVVIRPSLEALTIADLLNAKPIRLCVSRVSEDGSVQTKTVLIRPYVARTISRREPEGLRPSPGNGNFSFEVQGSVDGVWKEGDIIELRVYEPEKEGGPFVTIPDAQIVRDCQTSWANIENWTGEDADPPQEEIEE